MRRLAANQLLLLWRRLLLKRNAGIRSDDIGDLDHAFGDRAVVIGCSKFRHHAATDVANLGVGKNSLKSESNFDPTLVVLNREEHQNAAI